MNHRRGPVLIEDPAGEQITLPSPDDAPPVPDGAAIAVRGSAMLTVTAALARPVSWFSRLVWGAIVGLIGIMVAVSTWDFVTGLLARNVVLAQASAVFLVIIGAAMVLMVLRESMAFARLRRVDKLQSQALAIRVTDDRAEAQALLRRLDALYSRREELRWGRASLARHSAEVLDADALLDLAETHLLQPLDAMARRRVEAASRQVAAVTAIVPLAFADVAVALVANVRMVRQIAEIYGGRAGFFGSWRLLRAVATHLLATGAVAVGDDMIGSVAGGSMLAKLSRRFGEGVINGALTARVGIAAMEVCRPMPFHAARKPGVSAITGSALKGLFGGAK